MSEKPQPPQATGTPTITEADVRHVAKLARLELTDDQVHAYTGQLGAVLGYIDQLNEVDIEGVEPLAHPLDLVNVLRDDVSVPGSDRDVMLQNAPDRQGPFFKVPKVLGDGGGA
ncbi:MAG: Asp-tRNA(Asn)/Glu-tRNA(Gln) amidotransferase subunit GatC [Planctomycetota bacterium]